LTLAAFRKYHQTTVGMRAALTVGGNGAKAEPVAAVDGDAGPSPASSANFAGCASSANFDRQQARLGVLSEAMRTFSEATEDPARVIDTVARRVAEIIRDYCVVLLVSEDGLRVEPAAAFDPDPDTCRRLREALCEPLVLERHALVREVLESRAPFFAPTLDLSRLPRSAQIGHLMRDIGIHSLLVVALHAQARANGLRAIGVLILARFRPESPPFDPQDLELAENLAAHAALAITNARLLAEARRESADKKRMADRLRVLTDAARDFAATTFDLEVLVQVVVRRLGEEVGDLCSLRMTSDDGQWLEAKGAIYHRDPELLAAAREVMVSGRQRVSEGISGRVMATGRPLLVPRIEPAAYPASSEPRYRPLLERLAVTSAITVPLMCRGELVGLVNLLRTGAGPSYTEEDLAFVQSVADHAALAIGNARSFALAEAARDAAEQALAAQRKAEARFATLSEAGVIGVVVGQVGGRILEINESLLALIGHSREEILSGRIAWSELTPSDWRHVDERAIAQINATGVAGLREKELLRKDGRRVPVLVGSARIPGSTDEVISFVLDLTERKQAAAALEQLRSEREADRRFKSLLEAAPDAMVIADAEGAIVFVNAQVEALFGYARAEILHQPIEVLVPERYRTGHVTQRAGYLGDASVRRMGSALDLWGRRKDGTEFPMEVSLSPLDTEGGRLVSSAIRDITLRKQEEAQRALLAAIVSSTADAVIAKRLDGTIVSWNLGGEQLFGYSADEIVGRSVSVLIPPGREAEEERILKTVGGGEVLHFDTVRRRKDGRDIEVSVTISPLRDPRGRIVGISKVARDITDRRRAAEALAGAKERAEAANRELEAFSYSVAHDLRAPLRGMSGFAQILLEDYSERLDADGQDCLREIRSNAEKMGQLIDALLSLSRVTRGEWRPALIDLSGLVRASAAALAASEPGRRVTVVIEENLWTRADPQLARVLFDNLLGNAWKFTGKVAAVRIEFGSRVHDGERALFVRDNGAGFDMAHAAKLFAPFQRVHTVAEFPGTGIGLATVQRIVHRHGGQIWAEGRVGEGATFHLRLPGTTRGRPEVGASTSTLEPGVVSTARSTP
jgi:PAS domain S-box-containing protein